MGDLKKKKTAYSSEKLETKEDEENIEEQIDVMSDQTIEKLRTYMKEFYEIQRSKKKDEE